MEKLFKVTGWSESGLAIKGELNKHKDSFDFPYLVQVSERGGLDVDGLPIVFEVGKEDEYKNWISLGHYIYKEITAEDEENIQYFYLWYYAQPQPIDASKIFSWFI